MSYQFESESITGAENTAEKRLKKLVKMLYLLIRRKDKKIARLRKRNHELIDAKGRVEK